LSINGGERSAINVSRVAGADGKETVNVSLFENGERKFSGAIVSLGNPPPPTETVISQPYVESAPVYYTTPRVYYSTPYYYTPRYYSGGYYGGGHYYGGTSLNFNFGGGGHRH